ncbi:30S ribosomal protein S9 [Lentisphaerota bacterium WC36G]|nr:30S ribosomal protein S9 [Lentisphaerae bacterium WC36]
MATKIDNEIISVGRRKSAVARVRMTPGTGVVTVNKRKIEDYFTIETTRGYINQPLVLTENLGKFDFKVNVKGGGITGQAGALRHGIARALIEENPELRPALKAAGMLTRDSRVKERKKPGQPGARKRFQFSKR